MSTASEDWRAARANAQHETKARGPTIDSVELVARLGGEYEVVIRGTALFSGAVPPAVQVGNRTVRDLVAEGDNVLRGVVDGGRPGDVVNVDLGPFGRSRGRVEKIQ